MKASLRFRDDQKPLFRAKVPLNILGFPFQSGVVAGESKELSLNLSTFFDSGPSLKMAYRPNDSINPFSLVLKTGIGHFGSPISSSMTMSAEFKLIGNQNPSFFVHFKPQLGDFTIKKSQTSSFSTSLLPKPNGVVSDDDGLVEVIQTPIVNNEYLLENGLFSSKKITVLPPESPAAGVVKSVFSGMTISATSVLPVRNRAAVNFRWGVKFPTQPAAAEMSAIRINPTAGISFQKFPLLVMNKISIVHVAHDESKDSNKVGPAPGLDLPGNAGIIEACLGVKHQLEFIQTENGMLRKAMEDLRSEIVAVKSVSLAGCENTRKYREGERGGKKQSGGKSNGDKKSSSELNGFGGKVTEGDVNEGLKKALMGVTGAATGI